MFSVQQNQQKQIISVIIFAHNKQFNFVSNVYGPDTLKILENGREYSHIVFHQ